MSISFDEVFLEFFDLLLKLAGCFEIRLESRQRCALYMIEFFSRFS